MPIPGEAAAHQSAQTARRQRVRLAAGFARNKGGPASLSPPTPPRRFLQQCPDSLPTWGRGWCVGAAKGSLACLGLPRSSQRSSASLRLRLLLGLPPFGCSTSAAESRNGNLPLSRPLWILEGSGRMGALRVPGTLAPPEGPPTRLWRGQRVRTKAPRKIQRPGERGGEATPFCTCKKQVDFLDSFISFFSL